LGRDDCREGATQFSNILIRIKAVALQRIAYVGGKVLLQGFEMFLKVTEYQCVEMIVRAANP
jgi:hypothetical protein